MIAIVDYGVGNLFSLVSSLKALGLEAEVTGDASRLRAADRIILPGVGAFGDARRKLDDTGLVPVIREEAEKKPLLGICLGRAFAEALGDKRGITRYGQFLLPMDETLVLVACDLSGRDYLGWSVDLPAQRVGDFDTELGKEFFLAFVRACPMSLHIRQMAGENTHHILEAVFKGAGRALKMAVAPDEKHRDEIPSTKGVL